MTEIRYEWKNELGWIFEDGFCLHLETFTMVGLKTGPYTTVLFSNKPFKAKN
jgi:hypothetical protein